MKAVDMERDFRKIGIPSFATSETVCSCTLCGRCAVDCSVAVNSPTMWVDAGDRLVKKGLEVENLCVTSFYPTVQDIARSFAGTLTSAQVDFTLLGGEERCCGYPLISAGRLDQAASQMRHNIEAVQKRLMTIH